MESIKPKLPPVTKVDRRRRYFLFALKAHLRYRTHFYNATDTKDFNSLTCLTSLAIYMQRKFSKLAIPHMRHLIYS